MRKGSKYHFVQVPHCCSGRTCAGLDYARVDSRERESDEASLTRSSLLVILLSMLAMVTYAGAEESNTDLAKKTQNPVADLISIPLQNNMNFGIGPNNRMQNVLNIQPVIPISLNREWNLITRTILPIIKQPNLATTSEDTWGLGDVNFSAFLSPADSGSFIWGVGPSVQLATGTHEATSTRKWAAGPSFVGLTIQGPWVMGALIQQVWSFAGNSDRRDLSRRSSNISSTTICRMGGI